MKIEQTRLREILLWLWRKHEQASKAFTITQRVFYETLLPKFPRITDTALEAILKNTQQADLNNQFIYLAPVDSMMPILYLHYDFTGTEWTLRLYLALFLPNDQGQPVAVGYRFETPEGAGQHDFYHVQMFRQFRSRNRSWDLPFCPSWLPDSEPSLPLDGTDPVNLIICMIISLYSTDLMKELKTSLQNQLKPHLNNMHCISRAVARRLPRSTKG